MFGHRSLAADHRPPGAAARAGRQGQARPVHRARHGLRRRRSSTPSRRAPVRRVRCRDHQPRRQAGRDRRDRRRQGPGRRDRRPLVHARQARPAHRRRASSTASRDADVARRAVRRGRGATFLDWAGRRAPRRPQRRLRPRLPAGRARRRHARRAGSLPGHAVARPRGLSRPRTSTSWPTWRASSSWASSPPTGRCPMPRRPRPLLIRLATDLPARDQRLQGRPSPTRSGSRRGGGDQAAADAALDAAKVELGPLQEPRPACSTRRSCASWCSTRASAWTAATWTPSGRSRSRSASCRARMARRCSRAARPRR